MHLITSRVLLIGLVIFVVVFPAKGEKWWPDFSCHQAKPSPRQRKAVSFHRMGWKNCVERYQKYKEGNCPEIFKLVDEDIVYQKESGDTVTFDTEKFIVYFGKEVGYQLKSPEAPEKKHMDKIRMGITECKKKHPEYEGLKNLETAVCEPWRNFLNCVEKAVEC